MFQQQNISMIHKISHESFLGWPHNRLYYCSAWLRLKLNTKWDSSTTTHHHHHHHHQELNITNTLAVIDPTLNVGFWGRRRQRLCSVFVVSFVVAAAVVPVN